MSGSAGTEAGRGGGLHQFAVVLGMGITGSSAGQQGYLGTARSPPACLWGFPAFSPVFWGEKLLCTWLSSPEGGGEAHGSPQAAALRDPSL